MYKMAAWNKLFPDAETASPCYLIIYSEYQAYGGPEDGGWYYPIKELIQYKQFASREEAELAKKKLEDEVESMTQEARKSHGQYCLDTMERLENMGLEADFLPEPDGPEEFYVSVVNSLPVYNNERPYYE